MFSFIKRLFRKPPDLTELERRLIETGFGVALTDELMQVARRHPPEKQLEALKKTLTRDSTPVVLAPSPHVILCIGANGSGKTTSVAKLAWHFRRQGKSVLLAAADTFRAAATLQLKMWGQELDIPVIASQMGADPSAVVFDALTAARARNVDILLIDTSGRLPTKQDLMQELAKIRRTIAKQIPQAPHETLLVLDATIGQNGLAQAAAFSPVTGIILTKLDTQAKGGLALAIQKELAIPIRWLGCGERPTDLTPFELTPYLDALFLTDS